MANSGVDLMSVSSNSISFTDSAESELRPPKKRKVAKKPRKSRPAVHIVRAPKRCFDHVRRRVKGNRPVIELKSQTVEKANCNRFVLAQINGSEMDTISPESITRLIWEMKNSLQQQNYGDLAKLIAMFTEMPMGKSRWYTTLLRYCLIVLLYDPLVKGTGLIDLFLEGVVGCRTEADKKEFLQDINRLPNNIHVSKYDDLWKEYPLPEQFDDRSLNLLCETLSKRVVLADDVESVDDSSDWESFDENDSTAGEASGNTTTEAENTNDLNEAMAQLEDRLLR